MSDFRWTDELADPLPELLRDGEWDRVERARTGGWWALEHQAVGDGTCWYHVRRKGAPLEPFLTLQDRRISDMRRLIATWLRQSWDVRLLGHKPGRRAIFRLGKGDRVDLVKVFRNPRHIPERWSLFPCDASATWSVPRIEQWDPQWKTLTVEHRPGVSMNTRWMQGQGTAADGARIASLLEWIAATPVPADFPKHFTVDKEVHTLKERLTDYNKTMARPRPEAAELTARVIEVLEQDPTAGDRIACHRDFHDKQILLDGDRGSLIDLDLVTLGPPALDPGNILAHLRLRSLRGAGIPWREIALGISGPTRERLGDEGLYRWVAASLMRLVLIYARRRRGATLIDDLLASTEQALARDGEWEGIL